MNIDRRKRIDAILNELSDLQSRTQELAEEEREAADNLMEHFGGSEKAEVGEAAACALEEASAAFDEIESQFNEAMN